MRRASQLCSSNEVLCLCRNKHIQNMHVVDLHGLHVHEAIEKTDNLVRLLRGFPCAFFSLGFLFFARSFSYHLAHYCDDQELYTDVWCAVNGCSFNEAECDNRQGAAQPGKHCTAVAGH
jgi:hypothetical protein